jgi:hypothetical protein
MAGLDPAIGATRHPIPEASPGMTNEVIEADREVL